MSSNPFAPPEAPGADVQWPAWEPPPSRPPVNPWAVVALVTAVVALVPIAVPAAVVALVQLGRRAGRGAGLAIAALVLSMIWIVFVALAAIGFASGDVTFGEDNLGRIGDAGSTTVGDCLAAPVDEGSFAPRADCNVPHDAEVYAVAPLPAHDWPGYGNLDGDADDVCRTAFRGYVGAPYLTSEYEYAWFTPDEAEWRSGEHRVVCVVLSGSDEPLRASVRGSRR